MQHPAHPGHFYPDFLSIPFEEYQMEYGIEAILCDLDNHFFHYNGKRWSEKIELRLGELRDQGFKIVLGSNNPKDRSHLASGGRLYLSRTYRQLARGEGKPDSSFFAEACELAGVGPEKFISSGDNWMRDSLGALQVGMLAATTDRLGWDALFEKPLQTRYRESELLANGYGIIRIYGKTHFVPECFSPKYSPRGEQTR